MPYATINPATGQTEKTYPTHTPAEVEAILQRAFDTFLEYRTTSCECYSSTQTWSQGKCRRNQCGSSCP